MTYRRGRRGGRADGADEVDESDAHGGDALSEGSAGRRGGRGGRGGWGNDPFAGVMDPDRDPRFLATGRAATAAMTCGKIDLLTSTPLGRRTPGASLIVRHPGGVAGSITISDPRVVGATPLRPVARKLAPTRGASPPPGALSYRTSRTSRTGRTSRTAR